MFIVISQVIPDGENLEKVLHGTLESFRRDKIHFFFLKASDDKQHGRILVRHITQDEYQKEFKLDVNTAKEYRKIDRKIRLYLLEKNILTSVDDTIRKECLT
jgi:hypothetical protein